jgi:hypothetical protein
MGDEFYSIIKMVSGEEVFSLIYIDDNGGDPIIVLQNPIVINMIENKHGAFIKVKPWIELSDEDFIFVKPDKIITMTETKDNKLIKIYDQYITDSSEEEDEMPSQYGKVKPNKNMGYLTSVKKARKDLENIFKLEVEDTKET